MKKLLAGLGMVVLVSLGLACDSVTPVAPADGVLTVTVNPTRIESGGEAVVTVLARKVDGFPVNPGTEVNLATTVGLIETPVFTNDRGIAEAVLRGNGDVGVATVTASSGSLDSAEITVQIGSLPFDISLNATPGEISVRNVPTGGFVIKLRATVIDDLGEGLKGAAVLFDAELGRLESKGEPVPTNANGVAKDTLTVRRNNLESLAGATFTISASTGGDPDMDFNAEIISVDETISVVGFPTDIFLVASPSSIPATGGTVTLSATVQDSLGSPLEGVGVQFDSQVGSPSTGSSIVNTDANGQAFATVTASEQDIRAFLPQNTFTVEARTSGGVGGAFLVDTEVVTIQGQPPLAGFTFAAAGCLDVTFTNTSTPAPTTADPVEYEWNFGDGTPVVSTNTRDPITHTFSNLPPNTTTAVFNVTLTATSAFGTDTVEQVVTVDPRPLPTFSFSQSTTVALQVSFNATASVASPVATFSWDFGDNTTGSGETTTHTYAMDGTYTVELTITDCTPSVSNSISLPVEVTP